MLYISPKGGRGRTYIFKLLIHSVTFILIIFLIYRRKFCDGHIILVFFALHITGILSHYSIEIFCILGKIKEVKGRSKSLFRESSERISEKLTFYLQFSVKKNDHRFPNRFKLSNFSKITRRKCIIPLQISDA